MQRIVTYIFLGLFLVLHTANAATSAPATATASASNTAEITKIIPLKKEDILEKNDSTWFPELQADPNSFYEEMELPEHADAEQDLEKVDI